MTKNNQIISQKKMFPLKTSQAKSAWRDLPKDVQNQVMI